MGEPFRKFQRGDKLKIPATTLNAWIDAARYVRDRHYAIRREARRDIRDTAVVVLIRNDSGANRNRFDVLGIDGVVIEPSVNEKEFKNRVCLKGITPDGEEHEGKFVILLEPVPAGRFGEACILGATVCRLNVTDEEHAFAEVEDGDPTQLKSDSSGSAQVLWKESGTGENKWAVVRIGAGGGKVTRVLGTIDEFDESTRIATVTPRYFPCGGSIPGRDEYGKIEVEDPSGCIFDLDADALQGLWVWADWMEPTEDEEPDGYRGCRWVAADRCCEDEG